MNVLILASIMAALFLAYANGANDNFKGVATVWASGIANYRTALIWATATTLLGSLAAIGLASSLVAVFTGKGLVAGVLVGTPAFSTAMAVGAGVTVFAATLLGMPISTTHSLTGALLGSALASRYQINFDHFVTSFAFPLVISPLIAVSVVVIISKSYEAFPHKLLAVGVGSSFRRNRALAATGLQSAGNSPADARVTEDDACPRRVRADQKSAIVLRDALHFASAGAVGFARGLNDTPKIAAIVLGTKALNLEIGISLIAVTIALGGILHSGKVAQTMSHRISVINRTDGLIGNLVTSALVVFASKWGVPVSTTHVSTGAIFGLGVVKGTLNWRVFSNIFLAWVITIPAALIIAFVTYSAIGETP